MKSINDYKQCASTIFQPIPDNWATYTDFWHKGNAFATLIDYFVQIEPTHPKRAAVVQEAVTFFDQHMAEWDGSYSKWWFDDFGWWGVAFLRARDEAPTLGVDAVACLARAQDCWGRNTQGTGVWDRADHTSFPQYGPRFPGGCWNRDYDANGGNPSMTWGGGRQNTVTNGQYLVLSLRNALVAPGNSVYTYAAQTLWKWVQAWSAVSPDTDKLLAYVGNGQAIFRERVGSYAGGQRDTEYSSTRYWAGDQGILLGALVDWAQLDPPNAPTYRRQAQDLLQGVLATLVDDQDHLLPWSPGSGDPDMPNYVTGPGVFMRYLNYAIQKDSNLKQYVQQDQHYRVLLQVNADNACSDPAKVPADWEKALNQLATLQAAIAILAPTPSLV